MHAGARLAPVIMACITGTSRGAPRLDLSAPREGLELVLMKMGHAGPPLEPRRRPQAGKSGDPRSQNADSSPQAQGALGFGLAVKRKGKCGAPRAPTACGLGHLRGG